MTQTIQKNQNYSLVPYKIDNNRTIDVTQIQDDVWLTQKQMAELFDCDRRSIGQHLINIFETQELDKNVVCQKIWHTTEHGAIKGKKQVKVVNHYNLDAIISVGYRVNSKRGILFRQWATQIIKDRIKQEYENRNSNKNTTTPQISTEKKERAKLIKDMLFKREITQKQIGKEIGLSYVSVCNAKNEYGVVWIDPNENANKYEVIRMLAKSIGIQDDYTTRAMDKIVAKLKDSNYLIIVDEAENLKTPVFRILRKIHDRCNFSFGLLFVGTERLYYNLARMRGELEYLTNRISCVESLDFLKEKDVKDLAGQIFGTLNDSCLKTFKEVCHSNARELFNLIKRTKDLINSGCELSPQTIKAASKFLIGGAI